MWQVRVTGDDSKRIAEELTQLALSCVQVAAGQDSDWTSGAVRRNKLQWSMESAVRAAAGEISVEPDEGRRLAAAAALKLIDNAGIAGGGGVGIARIFTSDPDDLPVAPGTFARHGLLVFAACLLAEKVAQERNPPGSPWVNRDRVIARGHLCDLLAISVDNYAKGQPPEQWWDTSFVAVTKMLSLYAVPDSEFDDAALPSLSVYGSDTADVNDPGPDVGLEPGPGLTQPEGPTDADEDAVVRRRRWLMGTRSGRTPAVSAGPQNAGAGSGRAWVRVVVLTVVLTLAGSITAAELLPGIPRLLFHWQDRYVDSYPIPTLPPRIEAVDSPLTLPNTTVQLFWMRNGSQQMPADQTANGRLPAVTAAVMPPEYQIATFQVLLSKTHRDADADHHLKLWIQVPTPMMVVGATLMKDPVHEGEAQDALNSLDKDNGGAAVKVPSLDGGDVLYQFRVEARPDHTNNGYLCGYNAKFVQVMVRSEDNTQTSQDGVVTPFPLYVPRGEGC
jgi:hypothetical protein